MKLRGVASTNLYFSLSFSLGLLSICRFALLVRFRVLVLCSRELDNQHEKKNMNATSATLTEGLVVTAGQSQYAQAKSSSTLDVTLARVFVEEDIVQQVARATAETSLRSAPGLDVSPSSSAALGSDAVQCHA